MKRLMMAAVVAMTVVVAWAETVSFSYQGALANADGSAITGDKNKTIEFRLYAGPTEQAAVLWGRSVSVRLDDNGFFNVELSDGAGSEITGVNGANLDQILAANAGKLYIGLTVAGSTGEIRPRQKVLSVPSAAYAEDVANAKNDFRVAGNAFVTGGLTVGGPMEVKNGLAVDQVSVGTNGITVGGTLTVASACTLKLVSGSKLEVASGAKIADANENDLFEKAVSAAVGQAAPKGVIVMWSGKADAVPAGWALCNGQTVNGVKTPDLRDRFIVGAGNAYKVNATGGCEKVALTVQEMPTHYHIYIGDGIYKDRTSLFNKHKNLGAYNIPSNHDGSWLGECNLEDGGGDSQRAMITGNAGGGAGDGGDWDAPGTVGSSTAHENRPPYYALCFIMKL